MLLTFSPALPDRSCVYFFSGQNFEISVDASSFLDTVISELMEMSNAAEAGPLPGEP